MQKKSTHPEKKSTKSTPAHQKKASPPPPKKHYGAFKSTHYDPCYLNLSNANSDKYSTFTDMNCPRFNWDTK